jgi:hypothetical protein
MRTVVSIVAAAALCASCSRDGASPRGSNLVHFEVDEGPVENGKHLKMTYTELERTGVFSKVAVKFTSGASISSIMVEMRGDCLVAQARGAKFFWDVKEPQAGEDPWTRTIEFSDVKGAQPSVTSIEDCKLMGLLK